MGFFDRAPAEPLDPRLKALLPPKGERQLLKNMRKEGAALLAALASDETLTYACNSDCAFATSVDFAALIAVTNTRMLIVRKGRFQEIRLDEIADASMGYDTN